MAAAKEGIVKDMCIYDALENLGFSKDLTVKRWKSIDNAEIRWTRIPKRNLRTNIDVIVVGSYGEGIGVAFESDVDVMIVDRSIKCFEKTPSHHEKARYDAVFKLDTREDYVPPGYSLLKEVSLKEKEDNSIALGFLKSAITRVNRKQYLQNNRDFMGAIPNNADYIAAFPCSIPSIEQWCSRKRRFDWPNKDLIDAIRKFDVFVVHVGMTNTDTARLQWRLSFTLAERELVRSFNDVQIKLYAVMKLLTKHHLKPVCENISSYMIKNVIFWVLEDTNNDVFTRENFCEILSVTLGRLKTYLVAKYLPNYMMCEMNLLHDKVSKSEGICLLNRLDEVMQDVRKAVFECPLIYKKDVRLEKGKCLSVLGQLLAVIPPHQCSDVERKLPLTFFFSDILHILSDQEIHLIETGMKWIEIVESVENVKDLLTLVKAVA